MKVLIKEARQWRKWLLEQGLAGKVQRPQTPQSMTTVCLSEIKLHNSYKRCIDVAIQKSGVNFSSLFLRQLRKSEADRIEALHNFREFSRSFEYFYQDMQT